MARPRKCPTPGKVAFRDQIAAQIVILQRQRNDQRREFTEQRAYECPSKRHWHLTSDRERK